MVRLRRVRSFVVAGCIAAAGLVPSRALADETHEDDARAHYRRGVELYDDGDYRLALVEFQRAHAMAGGYKALYNIGQVHFQLFEYANARVAFERYLALGGAEIPADRRAEVERDLATLKSRTAVLTVESNVEGAEISINDVPVGRAPIVQKLVDAGSPRVSASSPGFSPRTVVVTLAGGDTTTVRVDLEKTAPVVVVAPVAPVASRSEERGLPPLAIGGWITTGVLALGAVGTGIAATAASSRYDDMRTEPIQGSPQDARASLETQQDLVTGLSVATDVLIISAVAAAGISLYLSLRGRPTGGAVFAVGR